MNGTDPIAEALDRLANDVDTRPVGDPMPGIRRKARANRRRANTLLAAGLAAVIAAGLGVSSVLGDSANPGGAPGYAGTPSAAPTPAPSTPEPSREPSASTPSPSEPSPSEPSPSEPSLVEHDQASADVDGDGAADTIEVRLPPEDEAEQAQHFMAESTDIRLHVELATGRTVELRIDEGLVPAISGTADLDENGTAEVILGFTGGDAGWLEVYTWDGNTVAQALPAADSPEELAGNGAITLNTYSASATLIDGDLISWVPIDEESLRVRAWTWQLDGTRLVALEAEQLQCIDPDQRPFRLRPC